MAPLSQADIDSFFDRARRNGTPRSAKGTPAHSSPRAPAIHTVDDSDDEIVALDEGPPPSSSQSVSRRGFPKRLSSRPQDSSDDQGGSGDDIRDVQLSPVKQTWRLTSRRVVSDEDDESEGDVTPRRTVRAKRARGSSSEQVSSAPQRRTRSGPSKRATRDGKSRAPPEPPASGSDSDDSEQPRRTRQTAGRRGGAPATKRMTRGARRNQVETESDSDAASDLPPAKIRRHSSTRRRGSAKRERLDPDEESDAAAGTEEEGAGDIAMDEPERFVTSTRLRKRNETAQQRLLRKLKAKRLNLPSSSSEEEEELESEVKPETYDSEASFITDDDEGFDDRLMPSEFSLGYAQSQEYKFKVMFQYLLLLVIHGPDVLPLKGAQKEYMAPVAELRSYIRGIRNLRVRSQIWRADFVRAMEKYPSFLVSHLEEKETYCDACNRRNQHCWNAVYLAGKPYYPESHATKDQSDQSGDDSDEDDEEEEEEEEEKLPRSFNMGPHCMDSSRLYHALSHWEHALFRRIRAQYREILHAKGVDVSDNDSDDDNDGQIGGVGIPPARTRHLRDSSLPDERDVNAVLEWMEAQEYQNAAFEEFTRLEQSARTLGGDDAFRELEPDHR